VALDDADVAAGGGAGEEHALQGSGAQDASVQVGKDRGEVRGAEVRGDGSEIGRGGTGADGVDEVAAVAEEDADRVEEDLDVVGNRADAVVLWGSGGEAAAALSALSTMFA
jgi:hypothetical protein